MNTEERLGIAPLLMLIAALALVLGVVSGSTVVTSISLGAAVTALIAVLVVSRKG